MSSDSFRGSHATLGLAGGAPRRRPVRAMRGLDVVLRELGAVCSDEPCQCTLFTRERSGRRTQKLWPSGSASTTQLTSLPRPMSTRRAPSARILPTGIAVIKKGRLLMAGAFADSPPLTAMCVLTSRDAAVVYTAGVRWCCHLIAVKTAEVSIGCPVTRESGQASIGLRRFLSATATALHFPLVEQVQPDDAPQPVDG